MDDLLLAEHVHHTGWIGGDVRTRRQPALAREEGLAFVAEHVVGGEQRGLGMWGLGVDADRAEGERDRIERPEIGRHTGELEVDSERHVVVECDPVLAGADLTREIEMAVDHHRLERRHDIAGELAAALLAVVREQARQPLGISGIDRDLASP